MRILANLNVVGTLDIDTVANAGADTDRFLVQDANGVVKYRTGAEVASDIGAAVGYVSTVKHEVKLGEAISKGQAVYVSGSDGTNMIVSKASNASEATSSKTFGLLESGGAQNAKVFVITEGLLAGLDTSTATIGDPVWLGTDGNLIYGLGSKPYAPAHLVFIGIVTRVNANNGEIFIKVQNGFELQELHNVQITTTPADNTVLSYETSSSLYKMKSISTLLGYTPADDAGVVHIAGTETITGTKTFTATTTTFAKAVFNSPTGGATGEGIVVGKSIKLDASGVGEKAKIYVVSKDLSDSYGSGLQIQFANADDNKGFGFNLNTSGGYEIYTKDASAAWVKALTISNTQTATFTGNISAANLSGTNTGDQTLSGLGGVPTTRTLTINGTSYDLSADRSWTIPAGVGGSGTANQVAYWSGSSSVTGSPFLTLSLSSVDPNAPVGDLVITGGPSYKNANILINRYTNAWESGIRLQTNGATDWYVGQSATGSNNNIEFYSYGTSSASLTLIKSSANANFGASVGVGTTSLTGYSLRVAKNITGDITGIGVGSNGTVQSDVTSSASAFNTEINTAAASFTLDSLIHYRAAQGTKGAGSTITNQYGFIAHGSMTGATNNYGFFGSLDSAANRWNLYMSGTAANYINGDTSIGTLTGGYKLNVGGTLNVTGAMTGSTTATFTGRLTGAGLTSSAVGSGTVAQNASGWYRIARLFTSPQTDDPGAGVITISFRSPAMANPVTYVIKYFRSTQAVATLKLEKYGSEDYITDVRIINPTSSTAYYIELNFTATSYVGGHVFSIYYDQTLGDYSDITEIYTNTLPTGSASGTTIATLPFLDHGTTVHSLNVVSFGSFGSSVTANSFVKSGGLTSQFLKADGTVDGTTYQPALTNPVTGTGTAQYLAKFTTTGSTIGDSSMYYESGANFNAYTFGSIGVGNIYNTSQLNIHSNNQSEIYLQFGGNKYAHIGDNYGDFDITLANTGVHSTSTILYYNGSNTTQDDRILEIGTENLSRKIYVDAYGYVGIGSSPRTQSYGTANLFIKDHQNAFGSISIQTVAGTYGTIATQWLAQANQDYTKIGNWTNHDFIIFTNALDRISIKKGGDVIIGTAGNALYTGPSGLVRINANPGSGQSTNILLTSYLADLNTDTTVDIDFAAIDTNSVLGGQPHARIGYTGQYNDGINVAPDYEARGYFRIATRAEGSAGVLADRLLINHLGTVRLLNYTTNGFVKFSNSDGTLSVDTNTYVTTDTTQTITGQKTVSRLAATYSGTVQSFLIDGASGNGALTINAAADYAYLTFAQAQAAKIEIGIEGQTTNKGSLYINTIPQQGSTGASIYVKKSNGYVGILNIAPSTPLDVTGAGTFSGIVTASSFTATGATAVTMGGGSSAEGIRMTATNSTTYPVFLRSTNPAGGGETSPWLYIEASNPWGIWHNNPINTYDFTSAGSGGIAQNVGGYTNQVMVRIDPAAGYVQTAAGYKNSSGTVTLDNSGNTTGNAASATSATQVVTIQDSAPSAANGKLWWESDTGRLKVYWSSASAWIDTQPVPDMSIYYPKAGGVITGDVSIGQTLNVVGNTLVQGTISAFGDVIAYASSDKRLKDNITVIDSPIEKISKISGVSFSWNDKQSVYEVGKNDYGVIAQEIEEVLPELVTTRDNGYKAVRYEKIVPLLIEAIKQQQIQISELKDLLNN